MATPENRAGRLAVSCLLWLGTIAVASLLPACSVDLNEVVIDGQEPIDRIEFRGSGAVVWAQPDTSLEELVLTLGLFEDFRPGMTIEEAGEEIGPPTSSGSNRRGPFVEYERSGGKITVAWEEVRSGSAVYASWRLRAEPRDDLLEENLHPAIVGTLELHLSRTSELVVMVPGFDGPRLSVYLRNGRIDWIGWLQ